MPLSGSSYTLAFELRLSQIAAYARMQQLQSRRCGHCVDHGRLARLLQTRGERSLGAVHRAREQERGFVLELVSREHVAPGPYRRKRSVLARIALRGQGYRLQRRVLAEDGLDFLRRGADEPATLLGERCECRPADAGAPERIGAAVHQHGRAIGRLFEKYWSNGN